MLPAVGRLCTAAVLAVGDDMSNVMFRICFTLEFHSGGRPLTVLRRSRVSCPSKLQLIEWLRFSFRQRFLGCNCQRSAAENWHFFALYMTRYSQFLRCRRRAGRRQRPT